MVKIAFQWLIIALMGVAVHSAAQNDIDNPKIKWRFKTEGPIRGSSVINKQQILFGSADGYLYALNRGDGALQWKFKTMGAIVGAPAIAETSVVVVSRDGAIYALDTRTGKQNWQFKMALDLAAADMGWQYFTAGPVIVDDRVYIGSGDGNLYALDVATGRVLWKFMTKGQIRAAPLVKDGKIYQPSNDGYIYVINALEGKLLWKFETAGATLNSTDFGFDRNSMYTQPILRDKTLLVGSRDGNVYAIDTDTKQQAWSFAYDTTWAMSSAADAQAIYVGWSTNSLVSALDLATGKELWKFKAGAYVYTTPLLSENSVYVGSADGKLYRLDKNNGEKIWEYDLQREIYSSPVFDSTSATIFLGSDDGYFYAIENGQKPYKAIYLPEKNEGNLQYIVIDGRITAYLKERGFDQLETDELQQFIAARIADKVPSVIAFALPLIPDSIMGEHPAHGQMRKYLESGGKVLWFGDAPNYFELDENNNFTRSAARGSELLDVEYLNLNESGNYYSKSTQEGKNWGLPAWFKTTAAPVKDEGITVLAYDEFNRVSAFVKKFNDRPGTGYVSLRTWAWYAPIKDEDLALIHELAVYGLE